MQPNFLVVILSGLIPLITGFVWYSPRVMGTIWMKESGVNPTPPDGKKMLLIFGLTFLLGAMLASFVMTVVIHPMGLFSMLAHEETALADPNSELSQTVNGLMTKYGAHFRTFKHGVLHGALMSLFLALPVIGIIAMFEQKSAKYVWVHVGYWAITLGLMGGVICAFA